MGKGEGKGDGSGAIASGDGSGGCGCCSCWETDNTAPDPAKVGRWITDIPFLLAFITFWLGMIVCASMGFSSGDVSRLFFFVDYNGNRCGEGDLTDYKYSHWTHPMNTGTNICVKECPTTSWVKFTLEDNYIGGGTNSSGTNIGYTFSDSSSTAGQLECTVYFGTACINSALTVAQLRAGSSTKSCCTWTDGAPAPDGLYVCVPGALQTGGTSYAQEYVDSFSVLISAATSDLITGWYVLLACCLISLIMSFAWTYILKASASCFVWSCVALSNLTLIIATAACYYMYDKYKTAYDDSNLAADEQMMYLMLVALCIMGAAAVVLLCMTVCLCKQIRIAVGIIEAACEAVQSMPLIVLFPLCQYGIMLLFMVYWICVALYMASAGDYVKDDLTGVYTMEWNENMQKAIMYHFFGLLWNMAFLRHMTILILAGAFSVWYWTPLDDKLEGKFQSEHPAPILSSVKRSILYHTGTVAFGSFIIAVIQAIQIALEYLKRKQDSEILKYIITYVQCLVKCFERLMEYISKCAYIVTAAKGNMFCTAAWEAFGFLLRHMGQHVVVQWISEFLMILGKLFVVFATVAVCFFMAGSDPNISSPYILLICCACISYLVACLFLGVFDVAIDTILVCFCWEKDANGAMEDSEGNKRAYGTEGLIKFIDGAKQAAEEAKQKAAGGSVAPAPTEENKPDEQTPVQEA